MAPTIMVPDGRLPDVHRAIKLPEPERRSQPDFRLITIATRAIRPRARSGLATFVTNWLLISGLLSHGMFSGLFSGMMTIRNARA